MKDRLFLPQEALDRWMSDGSAELRDGRLTLASGRRFELTEALRVLREVGGGGDPRDLVGRVKALAELARLGAEILETSMLIGNDAYDVEPGWMGVPLGMPAESADGEKSEFALPSESDGPKTTPERPAAAARESGVDKKGEGRRAEKEPAVRPAARRQDGGRRRGKRPQ